MAPHGQVRLYRAQRVFGASDGLVSNTALVMGFAGSGIESGTVLFAGIAGLLAGAFSMAAGEYVSVASQRDLFQREIAMEAQELKEKPLEEQRELELIYRAKGLDRETAKAAAAKIMSNPETALDTLAREELGLDPDELWIARQGRGFELRGLCSRALSPRSFATSFCQNGGTGDGHSSRCNRSCSCWRHCWTPVRSRCRKVGRPPTACRRRRGSVTFVIGKLVGVNLG